MSSESLCSLTNSALNLELVYGIIVGINSLLDHGRTEGLGVSKLGIIQGTVNESIVQNLKAQTLVKVSSVTIDELIKLGKIKEYVKKVSETNNE